MRRLALTGLLCGALNAVGAESISSSTQPAAAPPLVSIERQGYAFEFPRVLAEQRLFGIAHGVTLLAESCREVPATAQATADVYARWYDQQHLQIEDLKSELATFYYGARADEASWQHIAAALNLRNQLTLTPEQLAAACATLPEALQQPRYDLSSLFQLEAALAAMAQATRIDTQATACSARLPEAERTRLAEAYAEWQRNENAAAETARTQMQHYWSITAAAGNPEEWLQAIRQRYAKPKDATCTGLADWLREPAASLTQSFVPAPTVMADLEAPSSEQVNAVASSAPASVPYTHESTAAPQASDASVAATPDNLFDSTMRAFDERPYENAAR